MKKSNSSKKQRLAARGLLLVVTLMVLLFSADVFSISLNLFFISDDISFMEENGNWTDEDHEHYDNCITIRNDIKDNSLTGFLLVQAGANVITKMIRMIIIIALFFADMFVLYLCGIIIKSDFVRYFKRLRRKVAKH